MFFSFTNKYKFLVNKRQAGNLPTARGKGARGRKIFLSPSLLLLLIFFFLTKAAIKNSNPLAEAGNLVAFTLQLAGKRAALSHKGKKTQKIAATAKGEWGGRGLSSSELSISVSQFKNQSLQTSTES